MVHPIERLRYVARATGVEQAVLVREAAQALATFRADPQALVTACRRTVDRQPTAGALWWLCCRTLTAADPMVEAWKTADEIEADLTPREVAHALPDDCRVCVLGWPELIGEALVRRGDVEALVVDVFEEGGGMTRRLGLSDGAAVDVAVSGLGAAAASADLVLLEASAVGDEAALAVAGSRAAAAVAAHAGVEVWLVAGLGRQLPGQVWDALTRRLGSDTPWTIELEEVPLDLVDRVVGPEGLRSVDMARSRVNCPVAAELCG